MKRKPLDNRIERSRYISKGYVDVVNRKVMKLELDPVDRELLKLARIHYGYKHDGDLIRFLLRKKLMKDGFYFGFGYYPKSVEVRAEYMYHKNMHQDSEMRQMYPEFFEKLEAEMIRRKKNKAKHTPHKFRKK